VNVTHALGAEYWRWRARQQPRSHDDIPRITRPAGWTPQWSAADVASYREEIAGFEERLAGLPPTEDRSELVDRRLLASAFARVRWEMDVLRMWQTQPRFYVDQTLGVVFDLLTVPDPGEGRLREVVAALEATTRILADGRANLEGHAVGPFAELAISELASVGEQLPAMAAGLLELPAAAAVADQMEAAARTATEELVAYREWLRERLPEMEARRPIGTEVFQWFLAEVALMPFTPEEILQIGRLELDRAVALETLERNRQVHGREPSDGLPARDADEQSKAEAEAELQVRRFYVEQGLLSQPESLRHYTNRPLPDYLAAIRWLGVTDDLTGPERLNEDGVSYVPTFTGEVPYFYAANLQDPRAGIVHEGAHYQQLALSWRHPNPLRRHYYDSGANEGIAFYNEELMLAAGLFEDAPRSRRIMYNFMRLRALRVEVDVRLATGDLDIAGAAEYLEHVVPMDADTAHEEAAFFAAYPGQALTYQIGKTQILRLFADSVRGKGDDFDLQAFHDRLWLEGNVPLALQRWELLGDDTDLRRVEQLRTHLAAEPDNDVLTRPLVTGDDTEGALSLTWVTIDGQHRRLRTDASARVYYVVEGSLRMQLAVGPETVLPAGGRQVVPRGTPYELSGHAVYLVANAPAFRPGDDTYEK
jgi:hypothetical protein